MVVPIPGVKVQLIGGIQINVHQPVGDLFHPMMFEVRAQGSPPKDLSHVFTEVQRYE